MVLYDPEEFIDDRSKSSSKHLNIRSSDLVLNAITAVRRGVDPDGDGIGLTFRPLGKSGEESARIPANNTPVPRQGRFVHIYSESFHSSFSTSFLYFSYN